MQGSRTANVVLTDRATLNQLSNAQLSTRLDWIGGRITLKQGRLTFIVGTWNRAAHKAFATPRQPFDFEISLRDVSEVIVRSWLGIKVLFVVLGDTQTVIGIRCWRTNELIAALKGH